MNSKKVESFLAIMTALIIVTLNCTGVFAAEDAAVTSGDDKEENIFVDFPTLQENEESPFDFIIDPQNLLFETEASVYGGGIVEEGANLLFHNHAEGEYDFSRDSDMLTVTNHSTVPVKISISAAIMDVGDLKIVQDKNFQEDGLPYVYLALIDNEGNEQPISENNETLISMEVQDTYSFGLTGECNSNADWSSISVHPKVVITWHVEPVLIDQETEEEQLMEDVRLTEEQDLNRDDSADAPHEKMSEEEAADEKETNRDAADQDILNKEE